MTVTSGEYDGVGASTCTGGSRWDVEEKYNLSVAGKGAVAFASLPSAAWLHFYLEHVGAVTGEHRANRRTRDHIGEIEHF